MKEVPSAVIKRLPRYYRFLENLLRNGISRISSRELSEKMSVTASQIRQDLNFFGGFGQQGYGYNVEYLYNEIGSILGIDKPNPTVIIGAGNLGQALAKYQSFKKRGFEIKAMFDIDPEKLGKDISGIPVLSMDGIEKYIDENNISIAVLTLSKSATRDVAERLYKCKIKGILNFSYVDLDVPPEIAFENVHVSDSLMTLSYKIAKSDEKHSKERM